MGTRSADFRSFILVGKVSKKIVLPNSFFAMSADHRLHFEFNVCELPRQNRSVFRKPEATFGKRSAVFVR